jgi:hypothetical protein
MPLPERKLDTILCQPFVILHIAMPRDEETVVDLANP